MDTPQVGVGLRMRAVGLLMALVAGLSSADITAAEPGVLRHSIDSIAQSALAEGPLAGIVIAAAHVLDTIALAGYGIEDLNSRKPIQPTTPFRIASLTKQFTAAAILQLAEHGRLSLDDDLSTYFPGFPSGGNRVTIRQLLNHTSGIVRRGVGDIIYRKNFRYTPESVLSFLGNEPFQFEPGSNWEYSNVGYVLLGLIVEKVSGLRLGQYLRQNIFTPLGMTDTYLIEDNSSVPQGYINTKSGLAPFQLRGNPAWAAGGAVSTAADLLKWQSALNHRRILTEESAALMYTPTALSDGVQIPYGFAARNGEIAGHALVGHTGWWAGFSSALMYFPKDTLTIVVLTNTGTMTPHAVNIAARIARMILEVDDTPRNPSRIEMPAPATLAGTYQRSSSTINVSNRGKQLYLQESKRRRPVRLRPLHDSIFGYGKWTVQFLATREHVWLLRFNDGVFWDLAEKTKRP